MDMDTVHAIDENGVFCPVQPVNLPDRCEVEVEIRNVTAAQQPSRDDVYAILGRRYSSGERDVAARHDEHQP